MPTLLGACDFLGFCLKQYYINQKLNNNATYILPNSLQYVHHSPKTDNKIMTNWSLKLLLETYLKNQVEKYMYIYKYICNKGHCKWLCRLTIHNYKETRICFFISVGEALLHNVIDMSSLKRRKNKKIKWVKFHHQLWLPFVLRKSHILRETQYRKTL